MYRHSDEQCKKISKSIALLRKAKDLIVLQDELVPEPTARSAFPGVSPGRGY